jgi:uncharacterized protein YbjT (DUF2867 family)
MKIVITGASGQLARRAAELVLAAVSAEDLILTTRTPASLASFAARGVDVRFADFAQPQRQSLRNAFAGAERLLLVSTTDMAQRVEQPLRNGTGADAERLEWTMRRNSSLREVLEPLRAASSSV